MEALSQDQPHVITHLQGSLGYVKSRPQAVLSICLLNLQNDNDGFKMKGQE